MLAAIVSVVSALIVYWLNRKVKHEADKAAQLQSKLNDINTGIVKGDETSVNSRIELLVNRLQDIDGSDTSGQSSKEDGTK
jgi:hypothetical protein